MTIRKIEQVVPALTVSEGAGVTVHRTLGTPALQQFDPFLMLDHFGSDIPDEYIAGFPDHPHRGFITLTYMLDGHMLHQDSMGNRGDLRAGGIQWMKAASGVIHSEMPQQSNGLMRGFQLWINLPAAEKMSRPAYQDFPAAQIPTVDAGGTRVKVISGEYAMRRGPVDDPHTDVTYLDVSLAPDSEFSHRLHPDLHTFLYVFEGQTGVGGQRVAAHNLVAFGPGDQIALAAGEHGARLILVAGRPLNEPVVQYGPFVMNTEDEIRQAFDDYRNDRLVRAEAGRNPA
ncbi:MAG: pirin family protein [Gammaproteobacteria bacterium]|nr:pirin family protein [Gammaproteobacteria bacterium]